MRLYFDRHGSYAGHSQHLGVAGCGCLSILLGLGCCALVVPWIWPFLVAQGALAWCGEAAWLAFLATCFLLLGRARARRHASAAPPRRGPRDWSPPGA
jgi:hypothetical protein